MRDNSIADNANLCLLVPEGQSKKVEVCKLIHWSLFPVHDCTD